MTLLATSALASSKTGEKNLSIIRASVCSSMGLLLTRRVHVVIDIYRGSRSSRDCDSSCESSNKRPLHDATVSTRAPLTSHLDHGSPPPFSFRTSEDARRWFDFKEKKPKRNRIDPHAVLC